MKIKVFGKDVNLRDNHCTMNATQTCKVANPYVNLYVKTTNVCGASCGFCEYRGEEEPFDMDKLFRIITELTNITILNKMSCTGGEPTLVLDRVKRIMNKAKELSPGTYTVLNTNGCHMMQLDGFEAVDNIALSRHHYNDARNQKIFGTHHVASRWAICEFHDKKKIHLRCNLIKGEIDCEKEIIKYLDSIAAMGVGDVDFAGLMPINDFAREKLVNIKDFDFGTYPDMYNNQNWNNKDWCRCSNFLYSPPDYPTIVRTYTRQNLKPEESEGTLVFDGQFLREKFGGEIII
jgi:pyruvate-formate lyase-activating enzyme